ncbi:hypothetical protein WICPIJ_003672 [Wickerhamomyces pijperi]|uniref:Rho GDP-dissociation inhibitor n=1 Tax=Wickerhamomyces pijperi TaxID=599730 RepID=A0A9P8Q938_WICPI|nr:hypothetical protein WICPIJ_003672 [Wickerhamomyces pijperi]
MSSTATDPSSTDDLTASTDSYKPSVKKTIEEYAQLDAEDESLQKWKRSLGLLGGEALPVTPGDKRKVVILEMALLINDDEPIIVDLTNETTLNNLSKTPFKIKEKSVYRLRIKFKVQHEIVTGIKYIQVIKKAGIRVDKVEDPLGSYPPSTKEKPCYTVELPETEAPSGLLARGGYGAQSKFVDDDGECHLSLNWSVEIVKNK